MEIFSLGMFSITIFFNFFLTFCVIHKHLPNCVVKFFLIEKFRTNSIKER